MSGEQLKCIKFDMSIDYKEDHAREAIDLLEAFEQAGKCSVTSASRSIFTYEVFGTLSEDDPLTEQDIEKLRGLGAKATLSI